MFFAEHGVFRVEVIDGDLIVDATGPFNEQLIRKYNKALQSSILCLKGTRWAQIIVLHGMSLFTPEAERELCNTLQDRKNNGLVLSAVVCGDVEYKALIADQMSRCYHRVGIEHDFFDTLTEAKQCLANSKQINI